MDLDRPRSSRVKQLTFALHDHVLTNCIVFSPDSEWIVYDIRSKQGSAFDGDRIERVRIRDGQIETLFRAQHGAYCGVATYSPTCDEVVFIYGPEHPTNDFTYGPARRQGLILDLGTREHRILDARDLAAPFTPGALRGGSHVHVFCPDGSLVSFTYDDYVLESLGNVGSHDHPQRTVAVSMIGKHVSVPRSHPRNHDGCGLSVVVVETTNAPAAGSDQISRAFEEAWVGTDGYVREDGSRQGKALAFQGNVMSPWGEAVPEVFIVDLPDDLTIAGSKPLEGTATTRPGPPAGCVQRRLTFTLTRKYPGIQGPRHWLRSSPDGSRIAYLMKDEAGIAQLWIVSPLGGEPTQITHNDQPISSAFTWSPCGEFIAHTMDGSVCLTEVASGTTLRLTDPSAEFAPRPEACVFSPDGKRIAFVAPANVDSRPFDQIFVVELD